MDSGNVKVLCRARGETHSKEGEGGYTVVIKKELKPTLNRDEGCELSKIHDFLLATPSSVRTQQMPRSKDYPSVFVQQPSVEDGVGLL